MAEKKKKTLKKKIKDFSNRKAKEYQKSAAMNYNAILGTDPFAEKQSELAQFKEGLLLIPKQARHAVMRGLNKKINTKAERKAAGLNYKKGGKVKIVDRQYLKGK